ncbi:btk-binding protein-related [Anaeramoeba flamelloides]|uniref:Btk-binding protein-related n=1 Tax=Anaeramoeba flamelloides TaxID=1746091 RepID=A0AAV7Z1A1_9EUKA|nr:btk-binding protein-related [Anaeramoeba flamelloides]
MTTKQPFYLINGTSLTNKTSTHNHVFKCGSGGDKVTAYVDETTCVRQYTGTSETKLHSQIKNVVQVASGYQHTIFLTEDGKVYGFGSQNSKDLGTNSAINSNTSGEFNYFKNNNLKVRKIAAGVFQSYFITTDNKYYACGSNSENRLGIFDNKSIQGPTLVTDVNVTDVWSGLYAYTVYYQQEDGKIIGAGKTVPSNPYTLTDETELKDLEIVNIAGGYSHFLFLFHTKEGAPQVYYISDKQKPRLWNELSGFRVTHLGMCCHNSVFTTEDNKVLCSTSTGGNVTDLTSQLPKIPTSQRWEICNKAWDATIFPVDDSNPLYEDFKNIYENQILVDCQLPNTDLKVHKTWIEQRFRNTFQTLEQRFAELNSDLSKELLDWAYGIKSFVSENGVEFLNSIKADPKSTLQNDLNILYHQEETKNFAILVKIQDEEDEDEEEDDEEDEENEFEEIPVHKFVLILKTNLFREMFVNVTEKSNSVKDFFEKSPESIEVFIKYLYLNKIELTADDEPEMIVEELKEAQEYYKLNENSNFTKELETIKNKFC